MTSIAAQGKMNNFISLSSSARKGIINKFLNVNIFDDLYNVVRDLSQETGVFLNKMDARNWEYEINKNNLLIKNKNNDLIDIQEKIEKTKSRLNQIKNDNSDLSIKYTNSDLRKIELNISENIRKINLFESTLENISQKYSKIEDALEAADEKIKSINLEEIRELKEERSNIEKKIIMISNMVRKISYILFQYYVIHVDFFSSKSKT